MSKNDSIFVKVKADKDSEPVPIDCSNFGGNLVDSCVGGAVVGAGLFIGHLLVTGINKLKDHFAKKKS